MSLVALFVLFLYLLYLPSYKGTKQSVHNTSYVSIVISNIISS